MLKYFGHIVPILIGFLDQPNGSLRNVKDQRGKMVVVLDLVLPAQVVQLDVEQYIVMGGMVVSKETMVTVE